MPRTLDREVRGASAATDGRPPSAFYTVANSRHFLGVVALLNSLRLVGHEEPLHILDCGLTPAQRAKLEPHAVIVSAPSEQTPTAVKNVIPLARPAEVMVFLDADVMVLRRLDDLIARARRGRVIAFTDDTPTRFFPEWAELGLGRPRRQTYVSAGHLLVPGEFADVVLRRVDEVSSRIDVSRTFVAGGDPGDPLYYLDQDVLNVVLATSVPEDRLEIMPARFVSYTPFRDLVISDERTLACRYTDGSAPLLLHHVLDKPWLRALPESAYSQLLIRLLGGPGLTVTPDARDVPLRLRTGRLARLDRGRAAAQAAVRARVRGRLGVRRRLAARRAEAARHRAGVPFSGK
jgi:hypothetical protein